MEQKKIEEKDEPLVPKKSEKKKLLGMLKSNNSKYGLGINDSE